MRFGVRRVCAFGRGRPPSETTPPAVYSQVCADEVMPSLHDSYVSMTFEVNASDEPTRWNFIPYRTNQVSDLFSASHRPPVLPPARLSARPPTQPQILRCTHSPAPPSPPLMLRFLAHAPLNTHLPSVELHRGRLKATGW